MTHESESQNSQTRQWSHHLCARTGEQKEGNQVRLKIGEKCPIHLRYHGCCGRAERKSSGQSQRKGPVTRMPDGRVLCSPAEMRRRLGKLLERQNAICAICGNFIDDIREAVIDHKLPRGMGAANRDDDWSNISGAHKICNQQKGSIRNYQPSDRKSAAAGDGGSDDAL